MTFPRAAYGWCLRIKLIQHHNSSLSKQWHGMEAVGKLLRTIRSPQKRNSAVGISTDSFLSMWLAYQHLPPGLPRHRWRESTRPKRQYRFSSSRSLGATYPMSPMECVSFFLVPLGSAPPANLPAHPCDIFKSSPRLPITVNGPLPPSGRDVANDRI